MPFVLPELTYPVNALEPHIDSRTMEIHHGKHHAAYTNNLNNAIKDTPLDNMSIEDLLSQLDMNNMLVRNNGGGYYNHCLFWELMSPHGGGEPSGELAEAIEETFGSFATFKEKICSSCDYPFRIRLGMVVCTSGWKTRDLLYTQSGQYANAKCWLWRDACTGYRCMGTCLLSIVSE